MRRVGDWIGITGNVPIQGIYGRCEKHSERRLNNSEHLFLFLSSPIG